MTEVQDGSGRAMFFSSPVPTWALAGTLDIKEFFRELISVSVAGQCLFPQPSSFVHLYQHNQMPGIPL